MKADSSNTEETRSDVRKATSLIGAVLLALPIIYVLSVGPAAKLAQYHVISPSAVVSFYAPLEWLARQSQPLGNLMRWYVLDVWRVKL